MPSFFYYPTMHSVFILQIFQQQKSSSNSLWRKTEKEKGEIKNKKRSKRRRRTFAWDACWFIRSVCFFVNFKHVSCLKCCMWKHNSNIMFRDWRQPTNIKWNNKNNNKKDDDKTYLFKVYWQLYFIASSNECVCVFVLKYFSAENLDEDESQLLLIIKFTLLGIPANSQRNIHKWFLMMLSL